jgi:hypothetical protein
MCTLRKKRRLKINDAKRQEKKCIQYHETFHRDYRSSSSSSLSLSLRNIEEHKLSGVNRERCFRKRYDAVLKALSAATDVAEVTR